MFSPAFIQSLNSSVGQHTMTVEKAVSIFEKYMMSPTDVTVLESGKLIVYEFPLEIRKSSIYNEILKTIKNNFKVLGFTEQSIIPNKYLMKSKEFCFLKNKPHKCESLCQKNGCNIIDCICECDDTNCLKIAIHL